MLSTVESLGEFCVLIFGYNLSYSFCEHFEYRPNTSGGRISEDTK